MSVDEAIEIVQRELDSGRLGYEGLYSNVQANYRDAMTALHMRVKKAMNDGEFDRYHTVSAWISELIDSAPRAPAPVAVNTTRYGREDELT